MHLPQHLGHHYIIELYDCDTKILDDINILKQVMIDTAKACKATIVEQYFHKFSPQGVSGTLVIAESHLNIHTWPEFGYAAVDIFTCGENLNPSAGHQVLVKALFAGRSTYQYISRGTQLNYNEVI